MMEPVAWLVKTRMGNIAWATWQPAGEPLVRLSDAEARIAELEREAVHLKAEISSSDTLIAAVEARAEAAEALLKEAGKALEPFAKVVQHDISTGEDDRDVFRPMPGQYARAERITVGHLRAARAIHHKIGVKDE